MYPFRSLWGKPISVAIVSLSSFARALVSFELEVMPSATATFTVSPVVGLGDEGAEVLVGCGDGKCRKLFGSALATVGSSWTPVEVLAEVAKFPLMSNV